MLHRDCSIYNFVVREPCGWCAMWVVCTGRCEPMVVADTRSACYAEGLPVYTMVASQDRLARYLPVNAFKPG